MKKFDCIGFDHPEYWSGYHYPQVVIPVYEKMTNQEVVKAIDQEFNACFDIFDTVWDDDHEKMVEEYKKELMQKPEKVFVEPNYEFEISEDDNEGIFNLYFSWVNPVTVNGITFLDN